MDLGHHGLESQTSLQPEVGCGPHRSCRMPQDISQEPQTCDFGGRQPRNSKNKFEGIIYKCTICFLRFWNFHCRANSDRLLGTAFKRATMCAMKRPTLA